MGERITVHNMVVDRSLLTVIYSCSSTTMPEPELANGEDEGGMMHRSSVLWVKDSKNKWHNADRIVEPHQAIFMVGEDLERSGIAAFSCSEGSGMQW